MSFLNRLIGKKNRTASWQRRYGIELVIDLDGFTLTGVRIGSPIDSLAFLGPDDDPHEVSPLHDYKDLGITVHESDDRRFFEQVTVYGTDYAGHTPFQGRFILNGREVTFDKTTTPEQFASVLKDWNITLNRDEETGEVEDAVIDKNRNVLEPSWEDGEMYDLEIYRNED